MIYIKSLLIYFSIAILLSVDAFIACIGVGIEKHNRKLMTITPLAIGALHIILPIIAFLTFDRLNLNFYGIGKYLSSAIFLILGLASLIKKEQQTRSLIVDLISIFLLALSVSLDSFIIGISLYISCHYILLPAVIFGIMSFLISKTALSIGNLIEDYSQLNLDLWAGWFFILLGLLTLLGIL